MLRSTSFRQIQEMGGCCLVSRFAERGTVCSPLQGAQRTGASAKFALQLNEQS